MSETYHRAVDIGHLRNNPLPRKCYSASPHAHTAALFRPQVKVIHNASVMGAVASCGLQLYNFGQTVSIPLWNENWEPDSFHTKIKVNKAVRHSFIF